MLYKNVKLIQIDLKYKIVIYNYQCLEKKKYLQCNYQEKNIIN